MSGKRAVAGLGVGALALVVLVGSRIFAEGEGASYVGDRKCKKCHLKMHKDWELREHAKAFQSLKAEDLGRTDETTKKACVACHATGFGKPSGFTAPDKTPDLANVGCEACHGPGSIHAAREKTENQKLKESNGDLRILRADAAACIACHNPHLSFKQKYGSK